MTRAYGDSILVTIHGVWSDNSGLRRLGTYCQSNLPGLHLYHFNYGDQFPTNVLDENVRRLVFETVRGRFKTLIETLSEYPEGLETKIYVVAHSFGTLALLEALHKPVRGLKVEQVVLLGSILGRWTDWEYLIDETGVLSHPPINIARPFDLVVRRGRRVGGERSGTLGFVARGRHIPIDVFKPGGHTSYDPDDFQDIVDIIRGRFDRSTSITDFDSFCAGLPWIKKQSLTLLRIMRIT